MERKSFAFKLTDKPTNSTSKWKARDGISTAACTELTPGDYRDFRKFNDNGYYC